MDRVFGAVEHEGAQLLLPGFERAAQARLTRPEALALEELRMGPFGLYPHELEGYASAAHRRYRRRGVPLAWIHHEQLARALGLVILRDPTVLCGILDGALIRLPPQGERADRFVGRHECAEHLLRARFDATHADVQALTIALAIEREDVVSALRQHGASAVRELARVHRRIPWWEIRARVALVRVCARGSGP